MIDQSGNPLYTKSFTVYTDIKDSEKAGEYLSQKICSTFDNEKPDVIIIFASSQYDYSTLLQTIKKQAFPKIIVGCSSAGEFISKTRGEGSISAIAISSSEMEFSIGLGRNVHENTKKAAQELCAGFKGIQDKKYTYRTALVLADALAGYTDELIDYLNQETLGTYQFIGGGAGDDVQFSRTHVFYNEKPETNAVVALEILSNKPFGIGIRHGWEPASKSMRVTESYGMRLVSVNAIPILEVLREFAKNTNQSFDEKDPIPFFLHNVLGIQSVHGHKLRVPLNINDDGSINYASDIPEGSLVNIMKTTSESAARAAKDATEDALRQLNGAQPKIAIVFDCVATRLRTGSDFDNELEAVQNQLQNTTFVGCNTYGQIARVHGQFSGFHNCTAVVGVL